MPWKNESDVPEQVKTHKGASLTLAQANRWAEIRDAVASSANPPDSPEAVAWTQWEKEYKLNDDKSAWVKEEPKQAQSRQLFALRMLDSQGIIVAVHLHRETLAADDDLQWVEALMALDFKDETGRHVTISKDDLETLARNFEDEVVGRKVFVDIDHMAEFAESDNPLSRARIGTVEKVKLGISKNPQTLGEAVLLCGVRLNKRGKQAIEGEEFGYISAVIHSKWKDRRPDHQEEFVKGKVLTSITLTNDPFVPWLAEVGSDVTPEIAKTTRALLTRMADSDKVERFALSLEGESLNDLRNRLQATLHKKLGLSDDQYVWAEDVQITNESQGMVIFRFKDALQGCDYSISPDGSIILAEEIFEVKTSWEKVEKAQLPLNRQGDSDMDPKEIEVLTRAKEKAEGDLKEAQEKLTRLEETEKKNKEAMLALKRETLHAKSQKVLAALALPNTKKRVIPPVILDRVGKIFKLILSNGDGSERITLQDVQQEAEGASTEMAAAVQEMATEVVAQAEETAQNISLETGTTEEVKQTKLQLLLIELASLLDKFKETETVEQAAMSHAPSKKPLDRDRSHSELVAERYKELLSRKPEDVPELLKFKSSRRAEEALKLAEKQITAEETAAA